MSCDVQSSVCSRFTCRNLLREDDHQLHEWATNFTARNVTWTPVSNEHIVNETAADCAAFRRRRGFVDVVDPETADFPIAYNVLTHSNANQAWVNYYIIVTVVQ